MVPIKTPATSPIATEDPAARETATARSLASDAEYRITKGSLLQALDTPRTSKNSENPTATAPKPDDVSARAARIDPPKFVALESA